VKDFSPIIVENHITGYIGSGEWIITNIDTVDDCDVENDEVFTFYHTSFPNERFQNQKTVVIADNDGELSYTH
jgi:hypothetical protein